MEEGYEQPILSFPLPVFGVECFGSALIHEGVFSRATGLVPPPPVVSYRSGVWGLERHWVVLAHHEVNTWSGAQVSFLVDRSLRQVERAIAVFPEEGAPEQIANGLCELYSVLASPLVALQLVEDVLDRRVDALLAQVSGISKEDRLRWKQVFAYPDRKTESWHEREAFAGLAEEVAGAVMDQSLRRKIERHLERFGYLGRLSPRGRSFEREDIMERLEAWGEAPLARYREEEASHEAVLERFQTFLSRTGLDAVDRDILRAYRHVAFWRLRVRELWAQMEEKIEAGTERLAGYLGMEPEQVLAMRLDELSSVLMDPEDSVPTPELNRRKQKDLAGVFVDHVVEFRFA